MRVQTGWRAAASRCPNVVDGAVRAARGVVGQRLREALAGIRGVVDGSNVLHSRGLAGAHLDAWTAGTVVEDGVPTRHERDHWVELAHRDRLRRVRAIRRGAQMA